MNFSFIDALYEDESFYVTSFTLVVLQIIGQLCMYFISRKYPSFFLSQDTDDFTVDELNESFKAYDMGEMNNAVSLSGCSGIEPSVLKPKATLSLATLKED